MNDILDELRANLLVRPIGPEVIRRAIAEIERLRRMNQNLIEQIGTYSIDKTAELL